MKAVQYAQLVIRSGYLKHKRKYGDLTRSEQAEVDVIQAMLEKYEAEQPEKARKALELVIEDRNRARGLTH